MSEPTMDERPVCFWSGQCRNIAEAQDRADALVRTGKAFMLADWQFEGDKIPHQFYEWRNALLGADDE